MQRRWLARWTTVAVLMLALPSRGQTRIPLELEHSSWLWAAGDENPAAEAVVFRRQLTLAREPRFAQLLITAETQYRLVVNGQAVGRGNEWTEPTRYDLAPLLQAGRNLLAVSVQPGKQRAGLICAMRAVDAEAGVVDVVSDASWLASRTAGNAGLAVETDDSDWAPAVVIAPYGGAPWGRLTRLSLSEAERAMDELQVQVAGLGVGQPTRSTFRGDYTDPTLAQQYQQYVAIDRESGQFRLGSTVSPLLFVRYSQAAPKGASIENPAEFDLDVFESDLAILAQSGLQPALRGFTWSDLLDSSGSWQPLAAQPHGTDLPQFQNTYQLYDYLLDRIQAHGLHALALLDYRDGLPSAVVPAPYLDKTLLAPRLWSGLVRGQALIAAYFSNRPVLVGYALASDALPPLPDRHEPLLLAAYRDYLAARYGGLAGLKDAWGSYAAYDRLEDVPLPSKAGGDPGAVDYHAMLQDLTLRRLNELVGGLRTVDAHHLFLYGDSADQPLLDAARLRVDLLGTYGLFPAPSQPLSNGPIPGYATALAPVHGSVKQPGGAIAGMLGGRLGAGLRGGQAGRLVQHDWLDVVGHGGAGLLAGPQWHLLANRGVGADAPADTVTLGRLADLVRASSVPLQPRPATVLLVRNRAVELGNEAATDRRAINRLARVLDRLHLTYDIRPTDAVGDLDPYQVVIVPTLTQVPSESFWGVVRTWAEDTSSSQRLLCLGRWAARDEYFQLRPLPPSLAALAGALVVSPPDAPPPSPVLLLGRPLTDLPTGRRLPLPLSQLAPLHVLNDDSIEIVGWVRGAAGGIGLPALAARRSGDNTVLTAGFTLGAGELETVPDEWYEHMADLLETVFSKAGVDGPTAVDPGLDVYLAADGRAAFLKERLGHSVDAGWTAARHEPELFWANAATTLHADGTVQVQVPLAPYAVAARHAAGEICGVAEGSSAVVRASRSSQAPLAIYADGPETLTLRLLGQPGTSYAVMVGEQDLGTRTAGPDGTVDIPVGTRQAAVRVAVAPAPSRSPLAPDDFMVVGDYYVALHHYGRALREFNRLGELYPGSGVATLAAGRRKRLLSQSAAVVFVNDSNRSIAVRYHGPSEVDGTVGPGKQRTFYLYEGDYREELLLPAEWSIYARSADQEKFTVQGGSVVIREWWVPASDDPTKLDPTSNARQKLTDAEQQALTQTAQNSLPKTAAQLAAGGGAAAGAEGESDELTGPEHIIRIDITRKNQEEGRPTRVIVRNSTKYAIALTVRHDPPVPNPPVFEEIALRPRGRYRTEYSAEGWISVYGKFVDNNQKIYTPINKSDGVEVTYTIREPSPRELKAEAEKAAQEKEARGAAPPEPTN